MSISSMLECKGSLWRAGKTDRDSRKGSVLNFGAAPILADFPCSVQSSSPSMMQAFAQQQTKVNTTILTDQDIDAEAGDKIIVVEDSDMPGGRGKTRTFLVVGDSDAVTNRAVLGSGLWQTQCWEQV